MRYHHHGLTHHEICQAGVFRVSVTTIGWSSLVIADSAIRRLRMICSYCDHAMTVRLQQVGAAAWSTLLWGGSLSEKMAALMIVICGAE